MTPESLVEAFARGLVSALVNVPAAVAPTVQPPAKPRRPRRRRTAPPGAVTVTPGNLPQPGFDHVDPPLPGFEGLPPVRTMADLEREMARITQGNGPPPGFYDPNEDASVPLS